MCCLSLYCREDLNSCRPKFKSAEDKDGRCHVVNHQLTSLSRKRIYFWFQLVIQTSQLLAIDSRNMFLFQWFIKIWILFYSNWKQRKGLFPSRVTYCKQSWISFFFVLYSLDTFNSNHQWIFFRKMMFLCRAKGERRKFKCSSIWLYVN